MSQLITKAEVNVNCTSRTIAVAATLLGTMVVCSNVASAHCQIPCGIYDDELRFDMIAEDITTIEKSMNQIIELEKNPSQNLNQIVRWVNNKDEHADKLAEIISSYFLAQRIKPTDEVNEEAYQAYVHKLALLHQIMVHSMKAKQTTDLAQVEALRSLLEEFRKTHFGPEGPQHEH